MALIRLFAASVLAAACCAAGAADKQKHSGAMLPEVPASLTPEQADAFLSKLTDAQARELLSRQLHAAAEKRASAPPPAAAESGFGPSLLRVREDLESVQLEVGKRRGVIAAGTALLPAALASAAAQAFGGRSGGAIAAQIALLAVVLLAGAAASWAARVRLRSQGLQPEIRADAAVSARLAAGVQRFAIDLLPFAAFVLVTLVAGYVASDPGTPERSFFFTYITAAIVVSAGALLLRLVLSPAAAPLRLLPVGDVAATFLYRWLLALWALLVFGTLTLQLLIQAGVAGEARLMLVVASGTLVTLLLIAMVLAARAGVAGAIREGAAAGETGGLRGRFAATWHLFAVAYVLAVAWRWAAGVLDGQPSRLGATLASLAIVLAFPLLDRWIGRAIDDILGPAKDEGAPARHGLARALHWAIRILLAVMLLTGVGELWDFQLFEWQAQVRHALLGASFDLLAAFAVAVLGWQFIRVVIDRRLETREVDGVKIEASARLRTLLPLARVLLVTALIASTIMLVLSGLGVNIGPLLAGAGILGLAIGFGAQTLVRDIITGAFLVLDDAFRVGEYIQSGTYKGTVESIGLRSVKLRHHRGPIYVVPFGELRGVQNLARDWVIDKMTVGVTYDSDIDKAKKLVKKIGQELAADPELGKDILSPLKMQGLEQFGDFALQLRMKMTTKPGQQFVIRRRAYAMIKKAFDANGIKFAYPTVQVAGGDASAGVAVAAQSILDKNQPNLGEKG